MFNTSVIPSICNKRTIDPIPKSTCSDTRDPLSYRGISLASSVYKMYGSFLNNILSRWAEVNGVLEYEQGGFRWN